MPKAVRYDEFGGIDVLRVDEVERPVPGDGQVLIRVKAVGINPSEAVIRTGALADLFPSTFPSGQGSDFAGVIACQDVRHVRHARQICVRISPVTPTLHLTHIT
ncbi:alcohol dehydrogenase catalytic domain-containing protein [Streptomyces sp. NBC_00879]|uniref:alcohol dehydrogenase catalytic domain-containing protein n=1 Tax=Streptomyces sp. NBC_00879 TaxID=2975855 RepID=UPI003864A1E5